MTIQTNAQNMTPEHADAAPAAETAPASANDNTADVAPETLAAAEAARAQVPSPEAAVAPTHEAIMPLPTPEMPKPPQATGELTPIHDAKVENLILLPAVLVNAEKNLAAHIGAKIDPMLEQNLVLNVSSSLVKGTTNLVLSFEGDMVAANPAVLGEQVIQALHTLPAMQSLFAEHHHTPTADFQDGKLHVVIPHLTTAKYAHLVQALAAGVEVAHEAPKAVAKEEVALAAVPEQATVPAGHQCDASCTHAPAAEVAAVASEAPATIVGVPAQTQARIEPTTINGIAG